MGYTRKEFLRVTIGAGAALALGCRPQAQQGQAVASAQTGSQILLKTIPSSGERVPAIGLGTASSFSAAARDSAQRADLREVLRLFTELGGTVIDTSPSYGTSEQTIGELVREIGNADKLFTATKISGARGREAGVEQMNRSVERLQPQNIDLNQVHNLGDWRNQLALLRDLKAEGRIRYLGITTSSPRQYEELEQIMRAESMDFVQMDYAIDNREAEERLLPLALDRGMATLINGPFGRARLFRRVAGQPVPQWANEFGATSWAQFFLKWLVGHPAVSVPIPATSNPANLRDNMGALLGRAPDAAERQRMAALIEGMPAPA
jgi:aryl-alcohol dehydrogenase-like predicted oxidoreductase